MTTKEAGTLRILVLADIHGNLPALEKVLAAEPDSDETWCLGDIVGYGPHPNECVARLRQRPRLTCVAGNHDWGSIGKLELDAFNADARQACEWTDANLTDESRRYLDSLQPNAVAPGDIVTPRFVASRPIDEDRMIEDGTLTRYGRPIEIARVIEMLVTDAGSYVTGQVIRVDGGSQCWPA